MTTAKRPAQVLAYWSLYRTCPSGRVVGGGNPRKSVRAIEIATEPQLVVDLPCGVSHMLPPSPPSPSVPSASASPPLLAPVKAASGSAGRGGASCEGRRWSHPSW